MRFTTFDFNPGPSNIQIQILQTDFYSVSCCAVGKNSLNMTDNGSFIESGDP